MIIVDHLTKRYGRRIVVDDLSFRVGQGEAAALWGPNGAGKTTVLRCMLGLVPFQGRISIAGHDSTRAGTAARAMLGFVPQELCLYDDLTALEALRYFGRLKRAQSGRPAAVLAEVGLADAATRRVRELSGGMKQRLALAAALLADPPVLILDELTSNLDSSARRGFLALLADLKRRGKTILFTSHRLSEIAALADRVMVLDQGRLRVDCTPNDLPESQGLKRVMKIVVAEPVIDHAVAVLQQRGFIASRNGVGLHVQVTGVRMPSPIRALADEAILIRDIEMIADIGHAETIDD